MGTATTSGSGANRPGSSARRVYVASRRSASRCTSRGVAVAAARGRVRTDMAAGATRRSASRAPASTCIRAGDVRTGAPRAGGCGVGHAGRRRTRGGKTTGSLGAPPRCGYVDQVWAGAGAWRRACGCRGGCGGFRKQSGLGVRLGLRCGEENTHMSERTRGLLPLGPRSSADRGATSVHNSRPTRWSRAPLPTPHRAPRQRAACAPLAPAVPARCPRAAEVAPPPPPCGIAPAAAPPTAPSPAARRAAAARRRPAPPWPCRRTRWRR